MKIYTRTGDQGETSLFGGGRVGKTHPRVEAYGTVDELSASLGLAAALLDDPEIVGRVQSIQSRLFVLGADLATPSGAAASSHVQRVPPTWAEELEVDIDTMTSSLEPLSGFILPAGTPGASALHVARTICRRAERRCFAASEQGHDITPEIPQYLNRLSDWLFTAARWANAGAGVTDVLWNPQEPGAGA